MVSIQRRSSALLAVVLLALVMAVPQLAFAAEGNSEDAAALQGGQFQAAPAVTVRYAVDAGGAWSWGADGATSSVAKGKQFTALRLQASGQVSGAIQYQAYVRGYGWQAVKANGKVAGTTGKKAKRVEAVRIALTGELASWYDVQYQVMGSNGKWQGWKANGKTAGKTGSKLRGLQVKLVPKARQSAAGKGLVNVRYRTKLKGSSKWLTYTQNNGKAGRTGRAKRISNFAIALDRGAYSGNIMYRVRLSSGKWKAWKKNGAATGNFKNIEAIQIKLTGSIADEYDVVYRTYAGKVGWQSRVRNGATAGTGKGRRIEAIQVQLVPKTARSGWVGSKTTWSYYKNGTMVANQWVSTKESPINVMTARSHRYWIDADGRLAVNRIIDPTAARDSAAGYVALATKSGYVLQSGKQKTSRGIVLADNKGALSSATGWLETGAYDVNDQKYYMVSIGSYSVAKTGFFTIGGKKYYGLPDEGYIVRDDVVFIEGNWYTVSAAGVLGKATSTAARIERYVQWAIDIAEDDSHGYSQYVRWGPDYDCSSLVVSALMNTGLKVGGATYTGNMRNELTKHGFKWHGNLKNLRRGDILLVHREGGRQHTEIYLGNGQTVGAHIAETGTIYGLAGDQTGHEIDVGPYYAIWQGYLRLGS